MYGEKGYHRKSIYAKRRKGTQGKLPRVSYRSKHGLNWPVKGRKGDGGVPDQGKVICKYRGLGEHS